MKTTGASASKLPRSSSRSTPTSRSDTPSSSDKPSSRDKPSSHDRLLSRDKPLPSTPNPKIVHTTARGANANRYLRGDSRPLSQSSVSPSRIGRPAGLRPRSGGASSFRRTSSLLSSAPDTPDSYIVTDEESAGLRSVNRVAREAREVRVANFSSSPPAASIPSSPLPTTPSYAALGAFDFDGFQPVTPQTAANSDSSVTPPFTSSLHLPPRSDSHALGIDLNQIATTINGDGASQYGDGHEFENFSGKVNVGDFDDADTEADVHSEVAHHSPKGRRLKRHDSPMGSIMRPATEDHAFSRHHAAEETIADRMESLTFFPVAVPHPIAAPQPHFGGPTHDPTAGLAGVRTPGKMRAAAAAAARAAVPPSEPGFARRTASSAAKSSAPPDIPRMSNREVQMPSKGRRMIGKLGGLFHKGQKRDDIEHSPIRMRLTRDPASNKLRAKRQSIIVKKRASTQAPFLPEKAPEKKPSPLEKIESQVAITPATVSHPSTEHVQGEGTVPRSFIPLPAASGEATIELCQRLLNQITTETDTRRINKIRGFVESLERGLQNIRDAGKWAKEAWTAADNAQRSMEHSEKLLSFMRERATKAIRK
ncbi:uncharacterized protein RCC_03416 [Ramularia collo-cygni]|uniref:Uncharacterized protein n=1 Tax=Ramularia collo-cygni TaxID=112498 RepID=A0A2D3UNG9_9PEZI|nr:uncharacterized protein RCC_03416 [Ramularia collo-cygni]CZT17582.1 uncharacterized protein RCC_03416 [Ramularia collo-cygni]